MQSVRHQCLACTGLTVDQHVTIGLPQIQNILAQAFHHGRAADELFHQLTAIRQLAAQGTVVHHQPACVGRLLGQLAHPVGIERFFQKIKRADAHGFYGHRHIAVASDHNYGQGAIGAHQFFQKLHPAHTGHLDVGNHDTGVIRPQCFQCILGAAEGLCVIA